MHVGIDNGLKGGIVALPDVERVSPDGRYLPPIAMIAMPTYERKRRAKGRKKKPKMEMELDIDAFKKFLDEECHAKNDPSTVFHVEQAPRHAPSANSLRVMNFTYGMILATIKCTYPLAQVFRVRCGNDNDGWQKALLPGVASKETKPAAEALARQLWPEETWLPNTKNAANDGVIDAALIAHFGRSKHKARP